MRIMESKGLVSLDIGGNTPKTYFIINYLIFVVTMVGDT